MSKPLKSGVHPLLSFELILALQIISSLTTSMWPSLEAINKK
jgi:hypothetical protein